MVIFSLFGGIPYTNLFAQKNRKTVKRSISKPKSSRRSDTHLAKDRNSGHDNLESTANELIEKGYLSQALKVYEAYSKYDPHNKAIKPKLARLYAWNKKYDEALKIYNGMLKENPENRDAQKSIAQTYAWAKEFDVSIHKYSSYLEKYPRDIEARKGLAQVYAWKRDYSRAIEEYKNALKIAPHDKELNRGLAQTLGWMGEVDKAVQQYKKILDLHSDYIDAYRELGILYARDQHFDKAYYYLNKALQIDSNDIQSYVELATVARWDRRFGLAEENYYRALDFKPNYQPAMEGLKALESMESLNISMGLEEDYLSKLYFTSASYPLWRKQDIFLNYSFLDRTYYFRERAKVEIQHYLSTRTLLNFAYAQTRYSYPDSVNPDNTSLTRSNELSLKFRTYLTRTWQVQMGYRFSRTDLFHWENVTGQVHFFQFGLQKYWSPWLSTRMGVALLHDFDPGISDTLQYRDFTLLQGALYLTPAHWLDMGFYYIPNRDLDNSIKNTYMAQTRLGLTHSFGLRFRYRHDEYRKGTLIDEYLAGFDVEMLQHFRLMVAYKRINGPVKQGDYFFINLLTKIYRNL